jgi:hypothetical protein
MAAAATIESDLIDMQCLQENPTAPSTPQTPCAAGTMFEPDQTPILVETASGPRHPDRNGRLWMRYLKALSVILMYAESHAETSV